MALPLGPIAAKFVPFALANPIAGGIIAVTAITGYAIYEEAKDSKK